MCKNIYIVFFFFTYFHSVDVTRDTQGKELLNVIVRAYKAVENGAHYEDGLVGQITVYPDVEEAKILVIGETSTEYDIC